MKDHEYAMRDALERALSTIDPTDEELAEECGLDEESAPYDWEEARSDHAATAILSIDVEHVVDVMLTVGGPTCYFRVWCDEDYDVNRVEYHDSWASPVTVVQLSDDEVARVMSVIEPHLDMLKDATR